jgi:hypothetical protein
VIATGAFCSRPAIAIAIASAAAISISDQHRRSTGACLLREAADRVVGLQRCGEDGSARGLIQCGGFYDVFNMRAG